MEKKYQIVINVNEDFSTESLDRLLNEGAFGTIDGEDDYTIWKVREIKEIIA